MPALEEEAAPVVAIVPTPSYESSTRREQEEVTDDMQNKTIKTLSVESGEMKTENYNTLEKEATQEEEKKEEQVVEVAESGDKTETKTESNAESGETKHGGVVLRKRRTPEKKEGKDEDVSPPKKVK